MSHMRKLAQASVVAMALGAVAASGTGTATADPNPPTPYRTYAAVGSDTIQDVWNGLTNTGTNPPIKQVSSWDAFGDSNCTTDSSVPTPTIKTKAAGACFTRPAGSGNGAKALSAVWDPNYPSHLWQGVALTHDEVDFARSSGGPTAGTGLKYLPFSRDAVSVAFKPFGTGTAITNFSTAQLAAIYGGPDDNTAGTQVSYNGAGLPVFKNHVLTPLLPQNGSGTRNFFQNAIGIPDSDAAGYVQTTSVIPENDGTQLDAAGKLIPFSAAQWISQRNGVAPTDTTAGDQLLALNNKAPVAGTAPTLSTGALFGAKNSAGFYTPLTTSGVGTFARDTYNVVPTLFFSGTSVQKQLVNKLTGSAAGQLGATNAQSTIKKYGFGRLAYFGDASQFLDGSFLH